MRTTHLLSLIALTACANGSSGKLEPSGDSRDSDAAAPDTAPRRAAGSEDGEPLYAPDRVLDVSIELEPDEWQVMRSETRNLIEMYGSKII